MADIAHLGISVGMQGGKEAAVDLDRLSAASQKAERAAIGLSEKSEQAARKIAGANDNITASARRVRAGLDGTSTAARGATASFHLLRSALGPLMALMSISALASYGDTWSTLEWRVRNASDSAADAARTMGRLSEVARASWSPIEQVAEGFLRQEAALSSLGYTTAQQIDLLEALNSAILISGMRGQRAEMIADAWSKAMARGTLRGDELNTVLLNSSRLSQLLADAMGVGVNELRKLGEEGKITADVMYRITDRLPELRKEMEGDATLAGGFVILRNELLRYFGELDKATRATSSLGAGIVAVAENIDTVMKVVGAGILLVSAHLGGPFIAANLAATASIVKKTHALGLQSTALGRSVAMMGVYDVATRRLNVSMTIAAASARALSSALAFVGGPVGAAILAIGGALYVAGQRAQDARDRSERYAAAIQKAGTDSSSASGGIREVARALQEVETAATAAENAVTKAMAQADLASLADGMTAKIQQLGTTMGWASIEMQDQLQALRREFFSGQKSAEDFISEVDEIARLNPDASDIIAEIQRIAREAAAAMGVIDALGSTISEVLTTPKTSRLGAPEVLDDDDFNSRWGGRYADPWKKIFPDLYKSEKKSAGEREAERLSKAYDKLVLGARQFINEKEMESRALFMTEEAAARLRHEQDLLNKAANDNIKLTPKQREQLMGLAADAAAAEVGFNRLREALEFGKDLVKGFVSDLRSGLEQGKGFWRSFGDAAMNVLDKIVDKLLNNVIDALFQVNSAAGGGGGFLGGIFSGIGKLLGFASGGYTGPGPASQPAGIVHAGEYVFSKSAVDRIGLGYLDSLHSAAKGYMAGGYVRAHAPANLNMRGYQSGGYVRDAAPMPAPQVNIEQHYHIEGAVSSKDVQQMVRAGATEAVDTVKRSLSSWQHQIARDGAVA